MPRGDGTGPMGFGTITGKGAGYCAGLRRPGFVKQRFGGVRTMGYRRRGHRHMYYETGLPGWARPGYGSRSRSDWHTEGKDSEPVDYRNHLAPYSDQYQREYEKEALQNEAKMLEKYLKDINKRLEDLEEKNKDEQEQHEQNE